MEVSSSSMDREVTSKQVCENMVGGPSIRRRTTIGPKMETWIEPKVQQDGIVLELTSWTVFRGGIVRCVVVYLAKKTR